MLKFLIYLKLNVVQDKRQGSSFIDLYVYKPHRLRDQQWTRGRKNIRIRTQEDLWNVIFVYVTAIANTNSQKLQVSPLIQQKTGAVNNQSWIWQKDHGTISCPDNCLLGNPERGVIVFNCIRFGEPLCPALIESSNPKVIQSTLYKFSEATKQTKEKWIW